MGFCCCGLFLSLPQQQKAVAGPCKPLVACPAPARCFACVGSDEPFSSVFDFS